MQYIVYKRLLKSSWFWPAQEIFEKKKSMFGQVLGSFSLYKLFWFGKYVGICLYHSFT